MTAFLRNNLILIVKRLLLILGILALKEPMMILRNATDFFTTDNFSRISTDVTDKFICAVFLHNDLCISEINRAFYWKFNFFFLQHWKKHRLHAKVRLAQFFHGYPFGWYPKGNMNLLRVFLSTEITSGDQI